MAASLSVAAFSEQTSPWFTDFDDGTLIFLLSGGVGSTFRFFQNTDPETCGVPTDVSDRKEAPVTPTLPGDFQMSSGAFSRFDDRISLFIEELTPSRISNDDTHSINKNYITRYDFKNVESVGTSNGAANQTFTAGNVITLPTLGTPAIFVGGISAGTKFKLTDDLSAAAASDKVFEYDSGDGKITFGDGTNGAIPEDGKEIVLRISVRNGGGTWEFVEIVVAAGNGKNIGVVKSIKDKVFYSKCDIALIDASTFTNVHSKINVIEQTETLDGIDLFTIRYWSLTMGGEVTVTGGDVKTQNTAATGFVEKLPQRVLSGPFDHDFNTVPVGSIFNQNNHVPLDIDTAFPYPSLKATAPTLGQSVFAGVGNLPIAVVEATELKSGAIAFPNRYPVEVDVYPIFEVWEIIFHNTATIHAPNIDGQPCSIEFTAAPGYALFWFSWPDVYFHPTFGVETPGFPADTRINGYGFSSTSPSSNRDVFGAIRSNRGQKKMIEMADIVGDFNNPVFTNPGPVGAFPFGFNVGTDPTTVDTAPFPTFGGSAGRQQVYGTGLYGTIVVGDKSQRPSEIFMKWETRSVAENQETLDVFGASLFPNVETTWDVEEGNVVVLPDAPQVKQEVLDGGGNCINISVSFAALDVRLALIRSIVFNLQGKSAGIHPFRVTF